MTGKNKLGRSRIASAALTVLFAATFGGFAAVRAENVRAVQVATTARWQAETEAAAALLGECADGADDLLTYHRAMTASECAARAGDVPAAQAFADLAESIRLGGVSTVRETVEAYFSGDLPDLEPAVESEPDPIPESVLPADAAKKAEACARELVGERAVFTRGTVRPGDRLLFSASNAYVIVDPRTGEPTEFSLSLAPGENTLDARSCADAAMRFLMDVCPSALPDEADGAEPTVDFGDPGFARVQLPGVSVRVRRDTGRIVGLSVDDWMNMYGGKL